MDVTPEAVTLVLAFVDRIKSLLSHPAEAQLEPPGDDRDLIAQLEDAAEGGLQSRLPPPVVAKVETPVNATAEQGDDNGRWDVDQGRYLPPAKSRSPISKPPSVPLTAPKSAKPSPPQPPPSTTTMTARPALAPAPSASMPMFWSR